MGPPGFQQQGPSGSQHQQYRPFQQPHAPQQPQLPAQEKKPQLEVQYMASQDTMMKKLDAKIDKFPSFDESCHFVDAIEKLSKEAFLKHSFSEPLESCLTLSIKMEEEESDFVESLMRLEGQGYLPTHLSRKYEDLGKGTLFPLTSNETPPQLELKPLPSHLKYVFLGVNDTFPVIIYADLLPAEEEKLMRILRQFKIALGCYNNVNNSSFGMKLQGCEITYLSHGDQGIARPMRTTCRFKQQGPSGSSSISNTGPFQQPHAPQQPPTSCFKRKSLNLECRTGSQDTNVKKLDAKIDSCSVQPSIPYHILEVDK
nr:Integrase, catalytic core [Ipomoea batatas]